MGTFNITNASASDDWKFTVHDTESGIIYKLYSISDASVKATNTSTTNVVLTASGLPDGQYYILQMIPNIEVTQFDPNNVSSNVEFVLSESTPVTNVRLILHNVVMGERYSIFNYETNVIKGATTAYNNATIDIFGLPDGIYYISMGSGSQTTSIVKSTYVIGSVVVTTSVIGSLLYRRRKHD